MERITAICDSVISGNTFDTDTNIRIKLARVDTKPIFNKEGAAAKMQLESLIADNVITYEPVRNEPDGSIVAEVWVREKNVNDVMVSTGQ